MFEPTPTLPEFTFGQPVKWIGANNGQIWLARGLESDFEKCSNRLQLDLSSRLVNLLNELGANNGQIWLSRGYKSDFSNVWTDSNLAKIYFGQLFIWIEANNDQIWLPRGEMSDFEQCSNRLQLDLILLVNFWYELGKIMTRYVVLDARFVIWLAIDLLLLLVNVWFLANNDKIWLLEARWMIFSNIRTDLNFIFGQFSVVRKLILNGGAIWPRALLLLIAITWHPIITKHIGPLWWHRL